MKKKTIICLFGVVFGFIVVYGIGYKVGMSLKGGAIVYKDEVYDSNPAVSYIEDENVANIENIVVNSSMKFILEKYDLETKNITATNEKVPVQLLGMTREQLIEYLGNNTRIFDEENEKIDSLMLVAMDKEQVVIRKTISVIEEETTTEEIIVYNYYVTLNDDKIIVYKEDRTTVFLETVINIETIDSDSREKLKEGIPVKNISELYRILESFTT